MSSSVRPAVGHERFRKPLFDSGRPSVAAVCGLLKIINEIMRLVLTMRLAQVVLNNLHGHRTPRTETT
ncbi:hypothetical protein, partial [Dokdonella sp.]|uniref:hypothetical protein n=1 Tax=Dokdonella sp. TaxID=2291710 RepID=UPI002BCF24DF